MPPSTPANLEPRFLQPEGWQWGHFSRNDRKIRFGFAQPKDVPPKAIIVCLPGLSEFAEKYYEVAHDCLNQGFAFTVIDWMGQGKSGRYIEDAPHKRHSTGFDDDIADLEYWIEHSVMQEIGGSIPLVMLAHSMGGNIGLRDLARHPEHFSCAAFSAPMFGIHDLPRMPLVLNATLTKILSTFNAKGYVFGGHDWRAEMRPDIFPNLFSSDKTRADIHNAWSIADSELQVGSVTFGWLYEAVKSCRRIQNLEFNALKTPCLIASAAHEKIVNNTSIKAVAKRLPACEHVIYDDAYHELLMEQNTIRGDFLQRFFQLIKENTNP